MMTDRDMHGQVAASLFEQAPDFNIAAIVDEIKADRGLIDINTLGDSYYWDTVKKHVKSTESDDSDA